MNECAEHPHGTRPRYHTGCRCRPCKDAELAYANRRNRLIAYGQWQPYVDAQPVRAHIRTLQAAGLGRRRIAQFAGCSEHTLSNVLYGAHGTPNQRLRTEIAARILAVRPRLQDVHDRILVDGTGTRRRLRALAALGWTGTALAQHLGGDKTQLSLILTREGRTVFAATARSAIRVYDQLWNQDPVKHGVPAWAARRAARDAAARGWAPPGAWDDDTIDDPDAAPDLGEQARRQDALAAHPRDADPGRAAVRDRSGAMTRRLRTERMRDRAQQVRVTELLRTSGEEVRAALHRDGAVIGMVTFPAEFSAEEVERWQRAWDETMAREQPHRQRLVVLPSRTVIRSERPRKSTPHGTRRMRAHTRSLVLNALRGDGTPRTAARIAICRAYRVLPDEIGISHLGRIADGIRSAEEIRAEYAEHALADLGIIAADLSFGLPSGLEFVVSEDPRGTQIEAAHPASPWIDPNGDTDQ